MIGYRSSSVGQYLSQLMERSKTLETAFNLVVKKC